MKRGLYLSADTPMADRIMFNIAVRTDTRCWEWVGGRFSAGYGNITINRKVKYAHRISYETFVGPIPEGLELDHLCRNRACVNPEHLEPVTHAENLKRAPYFAERTHCPHGHEFTPENTYIQRNRRGTKVCIECRRAGVRAWNARQKAKRHAS